MARITTTTANIPVLAVTTVTSLAVFVGFGHNKQVAVLKSVCCDIIDCLGCRRHPTDVNVVESDIAT